LRTPSGDFHHIRHSYHRINPVIKHETIRRLSGAGRLRQAPLYRTAMPEREKVAVGPLNKPPSQLEEVFAVIAQKRAEIAQLDKGMQRQRSVLFVKHPRRYHSHSPPPRMPSTEVNVTRIRRSKPWPGGGGGGLGAEVLDDTKTMRCFPSAKLWSLRDELKTAELECRYGDVALLRRSLRPQNVLTSEDLPTLKVPQPRPMSCSEDLLAAARHVGPYRHAGSGVGTGSSWMIRDAAWHSTY